MLYLKLGHLKALLKTSERNKKCTHQLSFLFSSRQDSRLHLVSSSSSSAFFNCKQTKFSLIFSNTKNTKKTWIQESDETIRLFVYKNHSFFFKVSFLCFGKIICRNIFKEK